MPIIFAFSFAYNSVMKSEREPTTMKSVFSTKEGSIFYPPCFLLGDLHERTKCVAISMSKMQP